MVTLASTDRQPSVGALELYSYGSALLVGAVVYQTYRAVPGYPVPATQFGQGLIVYRPLVPATQPANNPDPE